ncbi:DNA ligase 1-like isoform X2 [Mercenaria mercenaria]|uniref:DNA ligase 1-like isoform X2 n=1 Tax=Mercenaria mercenaria TaxID=6596 RepID=UPI00234ED3E4|nr:DNA ligase 1-like isoform X2 [Mercenaria mercenaria]
MGCPESKTNYQTNPQEERCDNTKSPPSQEIAVENTDGKSEHLSGKTESKKNSDEKKKKKKEKGQKGKTCEQVSDVEAKWAVPEERDGKSEHLGGKTESKKNSEEKKKKEKGQKGKTCEQVSDVEAKWAVPEERDGKSENLGGKTESKMNTDDKKKKKKEKGQKGETCEQVSGGEAKRTVPEESRNNMSSMQSEPTKPMTEVSTANSNDPTKKHDEKKSKQGNNMALTQSERTKSMKEMPAANSNDLTKTHEEKKNKQVPGNSNVSVIHIVSQPGPVIPPEVKTPTVTSDEQVTQVEKENHDENQNERYVEKLESLISSTSEPIRPDRKLEKENKELKKEVQEKDGMLAKLKKDMEEKKNERITIKDSEELAKLKQQLKDMTTEKENIQIKMKEMEKEKDAVVARKVKEIRNLEKEKDELLCRLSEMAGRRLTDNNPNIADLSDLNRPTKLAEKYAELYDNDWTDAYSYLETLDAYKGSEETMIASLMKMLTTAYKMSLETAESQLEALHHILSDFRGSIPHPDQQVKDVIKQLKDQRKRAVQPSKDLTEKYRKKIEKAFPKLGSSILESEALKLYLQKCLELCWLMAIQDPPVHLKCDVCKSGDPFDKNMYKEYTQAGLSIKYAVWPAVFLEKNGALLCKGVVQCAKQRSRSFRSTQEKNVIQVPTKSASVRVTGTQALTIVHSDKVARETIVVTEDGHSEKRNSQTATDVDSTDLRIQDSETRITQL